MKMIKYILVTLLLLVPYVYIKADGCVLTGVVCSLENTPLKNVTVIVLNTDSSFVADKRTSENGAYKFNCLKRQDYIIQFSCIGFETRMYNLRISEDTTTLKNVILSEMTYRLNEISVKAPRYFRTDNALVMYPTKDMIKYSYSPYDLLRNMRIPGVIVDMQNNVKHFNTDVAVYIDGEKAEQRRVQSLRPGNIEKVEYIDNPFGKYSNDAIAINIITKNTDRGGYVSFEVAERLGYEKGEYNVSSQISSNSNTFSVWGGVNHNGCDGVSIQRNEFIDAMCGPVEIEKNLQGIGFRKNEQYIHAQMRRLYKKNSWVLRLGFVNSVSPHDDNKGLVLYNGGDQYDKSQYSRVSKKGFSPKISWYGDFKFKASSELTCFLNMDYNHMTHDRSYSENNYANLTHAKNKFINASAEINYNYKFKSRNVFSATVYNFLADARTDYSGTNVSTQRLFSDESLFFIGYKLNLIQNVSLYLRPGLSLLRQRLNGLDKDEAAFRLHSRFVWKMSSSHQISVKYNIGNTVADISSSSSLDQEIAPYHIKRGNPNLKSAHLYHLSFEYMFVAKNLNLTFAGDYHIADNFPLMTPFLEENKIIETYSSGVKSNEYDIGVIMAYNPFKNFSVQGMLLYTKIKTEGWNLYDSNILISNVNFAYSIKNFTLSVSMTPPYSGVKSGKGGIYAKCKNDWQYNFSCSMSKKNFRLEFKIDNIFSNKIVNREFLNTSFYSYNQDCSSKMYQRTAVVRVLYNFDFGNKKVKKDKTKIDNSIRDTILM